MGPIEQQINSKLSAEFGPDFLQLTNESFMHSVPPGSESHFKVVLVTDQFADKRLVQRHQAVYAVLSEELAGSVHALALHTMTPNEWVDAGGESPASPQCRGGSALEKKDVHQ